MYNKKRKKCNIVLSKSIFISCVQCFVTSEGETHWLTSNNPVILPNGSAMMLTLDCGVVCGQVIINFTSVVLS